MSKVKVGIIGCGNIAPGYVKGCRQFEILDVVACADVERDRARALAREHDLQAVTVPALLADPNISIIINLTVPAAHAEVSLAAIAAGKHVHSEKPLATTRAERTANPGGSPRAGRTRWLRPRHLSRRRLADLPPAAGRGAYWRARRGDGVHDGARRGVMAPQPGVFLSARRGSHV